jgi:hypothetical protein
MNHIKQEIEILRTMLKYSKDQEQKLELISAIDALEWVLDPTEYNLPSVKQMVVYVDD